MDQLEPPLIGQGPPGDSTAYHSANEDESDWRRRRPSAASSSQGPSSRRPSHQSFKSPRSSPATGNGYLAPENLWLGDSSDARMMPVPSSSASISSSSSRRRPSAGSYADPSASSSRRSIVQGTRDAEDYVSATLRGKKAAATSSADGMLQIPHRGPRKGRSTGVVGDHGKSLRSLYIEDSFARSRSPPLSPATGSQAVGGSSPRSRFLDLPETSVPMVSSNLDRGSNAGDGLGNGNSSSTSLPRREASGSKGGRLRSTSAVESSSNAAKVRKGKSRSNADQNVPDGLDLGLLVPPRATAMADKKSSSREDLSEGSSMAVADSSEKAPNSKGGLRTKIFGGLMRSNKKQGVSENLRAAALMDRNFSSASSSSQHAESSQVHEMAMKASESTSPSSQLPPKPSTLQTRPDLITRNTNSSLSVLDENKSDRSGSTYHSAGPSPPSRPGTGTQTSLAASLSPPHHRFQKTLPDEAPPETQPMTTSTTAESPFSSLLDPVPPQGSRDTDSQAKAMEGSVSQDAKAQNETANDAEVDADITAADESFGSARSISSLQRSGTWSAGGEKRMASFSGAAKHNNDSSSRSPEAYRFLNAASQKLRKSDNRHNDAQKPPQDVQTPLSPPAAVPVPETNEDTTEAEVLLRGSPRLDSPTREGLQKHRKRHSTSLRIRSDSAQSSSSNRSSWYIPLPRSSSLVGNDLPSPTASSSRPTPPPRSSSSMSGFFGTDPASPVTAQPSTPASPSAISSRRYERLQGSGMRTPSKRTPVGRTRSSSVVEKGSPRTAESVLARSTAMNRSTTQQAPETESGDLSSPIGGPSAGLPGDAISTEDSSAPADVGANLEARETRPKTESSKSLQGISGGRRGRASSMASVYEDAPQGSSSEESSGIRASAMEAQSEGGHRAPQSTPLGGGGGGMTSSRTEATLRPSTALSLNSDVPPALPRKSPLRAGVATPQGRPSTPKNQETPPRPLRAIVSQDQIQEYTKPLSSIDTAPASAQQASDDHRSLVDGHADRAAVEHSSEMSGRQSSNADASDGSQASHASISAAKVSKKSSERSIAEDINAAVDQAVQSELTAQEMARKSASSSATGKGFVLEPHPTPESHRTNRLRQVTPPALANAFMPRKMSFGTRESGKKWPFATMRGDDAEDDRASRFGRSTLRKKKEPPSSRPQIRRVFEPPKGPLPTGDLSGVDSASVDTIASLLPSRLPSSHPAIKQQRSLSSLQSGRTASPDVASLVSFDRKESSGSPALSLSSPVHSRFQAHATDPVAQLMPAPAWTKGEVSAETRRMLKRRNIIRELVETEHSYASDMAVIRDIYLERARALAGAPSTPGTPWSAVGGALPAWSPTASNRDRNISTPRIGFARSQSGDVSMGDSSGLNSPRMYRKASSPALGGSAQLFDARLQPMPSPASETVSNRSSMFTNETKSGSQPASFSSTDMATGPSGRYGKESGDTTSRHSEHETAVGGRTSEQSSGAGNESQASDWPKQDDRPFGNNKRWSRMSSVDPLSAAVLPASGPSASTSTGPHAHIAPPPPLAAPRDSNEVTTPTITTQRPSVTVDTQAVQMKPSFSSGHSLLSAQSDAAFVPLKPSDIRVIFAGVELCAALAEDMSHLLEESMGSVASEPLPSDASDFEDPLDDTIGGVFRRLSQRFQQVYSLYCSKHEPSIARLREVTSSPSSRASLFLLECTSIARKHTNAWDLASLLIKPVQRMLKYPLLLQEILATTPASHPDHANLVAAIEDIERVAESINEQNRRREIIAKILGGRSISSSGTSAGTSTPRTPSGPSPAPSGSRLAAAKTLRRKNVAKEQPNSTPLAAMVPHLLDGDEYTSLLSAFATLQRGVHSLEREVAQWPVSVRATYASQIRLLQSWDRVYALREEGSASEDRDGASEGITRLVALYQEALEGPWNQCERAVRHSILPALTKVGKAFEGPASIMQRRNDRLEDYTRFCATHNAKMPPPSSSADRKVIEGANGFAALHLQLVEELPAFFMGVQDMVDAVLAAFAQVQSGYMGAVHHRFGAYLDGLASSKAEANTSTQSNDSLASDATETTVASSVVIDGDSKASNLVRAWWIAHQQAISSIEDLKICAIGSASGSPPQHLLPGLPFMEDRQQQRRPSAPQLSNAKQQESQHYSRRPSMMSDFAGNKSLRAQPPPLPSDRGERHRMPATSPIVPAFAPEAANVLHSTSSKSGPRLAPIPSASGSRKSHNLLRSISGTFRGGNASEEVELPKSASSSPALPTMPEFHSEGQTLAPMLPSLDLGAGDLSPDMNAGGPAAFNKDGSQSYF